jgi:hypothetical protein
MVSDEHEDRVGIPPKIADVKTMNSLRVNMTAAYSSIDAQRLSSGRGP